MARWRYIVIASGEVEAPEIDHATMQVKMGVSMSTRLLGTPNQIKIEVFDADLAEGALRKVIRSFAGEQGLSLTDLVKQMKGSKDDS